MASTYKDPSDYLAWYIVGDDLAIVTSKTTSDGSSTVLASSDKGTYKSIDEAVTNGILVSYDAEPTAVTGLADYPDIDNSMHNAIIDYVKYRLYLDTGTPELISLALTHKKNWEESIKRFCMRKRDKTGGTRSLVPYNLR